MVDIRIQLMVPTNLHLTVSKAVGEVVEACKRPTGITKVATRQPPETKMATSGTTAIAISNRRDLTTIEDVAKGTDSMGALSTSSSWAAAVSTAQEQCQSTPQVALKPLTLATTLT